jgi:hypothetical protein
MLKLAALEDATTAAGALRLSSLDEHERLTREHERISPSLGPMQARLDSLTRAGAAQERATRAAVALQVEAKVYFG